jgi:hypothetical protein
MSQRETIATIKRHAAKAPWIAGVTDAPGAVQPEIPIAYLYVHGFKVAVSFTYDLLGQDAVEHVAFRPLNAEHLPPETQRKVLRLVFGHHSDEVMKFHKAGAKTYQFLYWRGKAGPEFFANV